jgi:hypothetical protein
MNGDPKFPDKEKDFYSILDDKESLFDGFCTDIMNIAY